MNPGVGPFFSTHRQIPTTKSCHKINKKKPLIFPQRPKLLASNPSLPTSFPSNIKFVLIISLSNLSQLKPFYTANLKRQWESNKFCSFRLMDVIPSPPSLPPHVVPSTSRTTTRLPSSTRFLPLSCRHSPVVVVTVANNFSSLQILNLEKGRIRKILDWENITKSTDHDIVISNSIMIYDLHVKVWDFYPKEVRILKDETNLSRVCSKCFFSFFVLCQLLANDIWISLTTLTPN